MIKLTEFCDEKIGRFYIDKPFVRDGRRCYTDGRILVWEDNIQDEKPDEKIKVPNADIIIKNGWFEADFKEIKLKTDYKKEMEECEECGGAGFVVCSECKHEDKCVNCGGLGEVEIFDLIKINEQFFLAKYISMLLELAHPKFYLNKTYLIGKWERGGFMLICFDNENDGEEEDESVEPIEEITI